MTDSTVCLACGGALQPFPALVATDRMHCIPGEWEIHDCTACGSGTTLPIVDESALGAFYPQSYAPFDVPRGALAAFMARLQRARDSRFPLAELAGDGPPGTLLDVGCGRGDLAASWIGAGWTVVGVEPSAQAAEVATRRGAQIVGATLDDAELAPASLDSVVFRHSLEHVVAPREALSRVMDALRPGGRLAVIVPNWGSWQRRTFADRWFPLELPRHRTHFTAAGLGAALSQAGYAGIDVRPATPFITTTWSLQFRLFDRLLTEAGPALLAGYVTSAAVAPSVAIIDRVRHGGDFLHAAARRPR